MDSDPPGPGGNANIPPVVPSAVGVQQMDQLGQPKLGQSQVGQSQMGQGSTNNPDVKTEDVKSEISGGENSQEPIYEETDSNDRQSVSQETPKVENVPTRPKIILTDKDEKKQIASIMKLLKKKGLESALSELKKETGLSEDEIKELTNETDVSQVLDQYKSNADKDSYKEAYQALIRFVDQSLDSTRAELSQLLYPCFAHFYLKLMINGHEEMAKKFYDEFAKGFEVDSPYMEDIKRLGSIVNRKQLEQNDIITTFKVRQFIIRLTRDSFISLKRTINEKKIQVLTDVVEDQLLIDQFDGLPRTQQQIDAVAGGLLGEAKRDANKTRILLGLFKEPEVPELENEDEQLDDLEPSKKKRKNKAITVRKTRPDHNAPAPTRIPIIGLTENQLTSADKMDWLLYYKDIEQRIKLTGDQRISCVYYSILNSNNGLQPTSVTFSDDSTMCAAGFEDGLIRVFSISTETLKRLKTPEEVMDMDKDQLDLENIQMPTGEKSKSLIGHSGSVFGISISPRRDFLVSGGEDGTVRLWSLLVYQCIIVHRGHMWPVWDVTFAPFGHYFASCGMDRTLRVWTTDKENPVRLMSGHNADVEVCKFHPNSNYIASGGADRCVRLFDVLDGKPVRILTGHRRAITTMAWSPVSGRYLATGDIGGQILFWDVSKSNKTDDILIARFSIEDQKIPQVPSFTKQHQQITSLVFSRCGNVITSATIKGLIISYDIAKVLADHENDEVAITANGIARNYRYHAAFKTKRSPVVNLHYTRRNCLLAAGPFCR